MQSSLSPASGTSFTALAGHSTISDEESRDEHYWRQHLMRQPFYIEGLRFEDYAPAFLMGHSRYRDDTLFEDVERRYGADWEEVKAGSRLSWFEARHAVRAAWERTAQRATN